MGGLYRRGKSSSNWRPASLPQYGLSESRYRPQKLPKSLKKAYRHAKYPLSEQFRRLKAIQQGRDRLFDVIFSFEDFVLVPSNNICSMT